MILLCECWPERSCLQLFAKIKSWRYLKQENDPACASLDVSRYCRSLFIALMQTSAIKNQMSLDGDDRLNNNQNLQWDAQMNITDPVVNFTVNVCCLTLNWVFEKQIWCECSLLSLMFTEWRHKWLMYANSLRLTVFIQCVFATLVPVCTCLVWGLDHWPVSWFRSGVFAHSKIFTF